MRVPFLTVCLFFIAGSSACADDPTRPTSDDQPGLPDADIRVLFIGNSLTFTNDLPALFATVTEAAGHSVAFSSVTVANFSLEDHWNAGVADVIARERADVVVLQQGPSSLPENQVRLRTWSENLAGSIRAAGGEPALYMVWPESTRMEAFDAVRDSYKDAAEAVNGPFIPGGETWRAAWARDPDLQLYGPDGFHPSQLGSIAVALTMYAVLFDTTVSHLPARLVPTSPGLDPIDLSPETAAILFAAVDETVGRF